MQSLAFIEHRDLMQDALLRFNACLVILPNYGKALCDRTAQVVLQPALESRKRTIFRDCNLHMK
jgi:hypothetical protein